MARSGKTVTQIITSSFWYQVPIKAKALGDQVLASTEYVSENKECNGVGWFILTVVKYLGKSMSSEF